MKPPRWLRPSCAEHSQNSVEVESRIYRILNEDSNSRIDRRNSTIESEQISRIIGKSENGSDIMLADSILAVDYVSNFLGIYLNRVLTWNAHIDSVCAKLSSGIYVLRSLTKYCPNQVLMTACDDLI
ncbi:hypothetical protein J6590_083132 [Homalodisca vitripennis]|nr:hypothetical protein J6590_083132 [Homalodisca vitripennis]